MFLGVPADVGTHALCFRNDEHAYTQKTSEIRKFLSALITRLFHLSPITYLLFHHLRHTIVIQITREERWRRDESAIRVGEHDTGREDLIGVRATDIESRVEE